MLLPWWWSIVGCTQSSNWREKVEKLFRQMRTKNFNNPIFWRWYSIVSCLSICQTYLYWNDCFTHAKIGQNSSVNNISTSLQTICAGLSDCRQHYVFLILLEFGSNPSDENFFMKQRLESANNNCYEIKRF